MPVCCFTKRVRKGLSVSHSETDRRERISRRPGEAVRHRDPDKSLAGWPCLYQYHDKQESPQAPSPPQAVPRNKRPRKKQRSAIRVPVSGNARPRRNAVSPYNEGLLCRRATTRPLRTLKRRWRRTAASKPLKSWWTMPATSMACASSSLSSVRIRGTYHEGQTLVNLVVEAD